MVVVMLVVVVGSGGLMDVIKHWLRGALGVVPLPPAALVAAGGEEGRVGRVL